jgi:hypothetical protein
MVLLAVVQVGTIITKFQVTNKTQRGARPLNASPYEENEQCDRLLMLSKRSWEKCSVIDSKVINGFTLDFFERFPEQFFRTLIKLQHKHARYFQLHDIIVPWKTSVNITWSYILQKN